AVSPRSSGQSWARASLARLDGAERRQEGFDELPILLRLEVLLDHFACPGQREIHGLVAELSERFVLFALDVAAGSLEHVLLFPPCLLEHVSAHLFRDGATVGDQLLRLAARGLDGGL